MDSVTPERELSDFEKGVIDGALLAGASRARAIQIAMEASPVMASQVSRANVADDVVKVFNEMKAQRDKEGEDENSKRKKVVLFCLSEDKKSIVLEEGQEILQEDVGNTVKDPLLHFAKMLPPNDCRYALYDATYHTRRVKRKDLVFIFWAPEGAPLESRMIYSRSRVVMKKKLAGIRHEWEVNSLEDAQDRRALARKLGGRAVVSLEGSPV